MISTEELSRDEVCDLEQEGIRIIQIDEAALKEKLPIRREEWYSEFEEIVKDIDNMDADVITFEASRSKLTIIDALKENDFETEVGPGVYDIHSPRIPSVDEITENLKKCLKRLIRTSFG